MEASPSPKALATVTAATRTLPGGSPTLRVRADAVSGHATPPAVGPARGSEPPPRPRAGPPLPFRTSLVARQPTPRGRRLPSGPRSSRPSRAAPSPPVPCMALVLPLKRPGSRPTPRELVTPRGPCGSGWRARSGSEVSALSGGRSAAARSAPPTTCPCAQDGGKRAALSGPPPGAWTRGLRDATRSPHPHAPLPTGGTSHVLSRSGVGLHPPQVPRRGAEAVTAEADGRREDLGAAVMACPLFKAGSRSNFATVLGPFFTTDGPIT